jgi:glutathione peroxidase
MGTLQDLYKKGNYVDNPYKNFYEISAKDINKKIVQMDEFYKKIILVVNFSPFDNDFKEEFDKLINLKNNFGDKLEILAFPSTQIDNLELSEREITEKINSMSLSMDKIRIFNKVYLNGDETSDVYKFCYRHSPLFLIKQGKSKYLGENFTKFLIDLNGQVYTMHNKAEDYSEIERDVKFLFGQRVDKIDIRKKFVVYNKFF